MAIFGNYPPRFINLGGFIFSEPAPWEAHSINLAYLGGVYALFLPSFGGWYPSYIGKTGSFESRIDASHHAVKQMLLEARKSKSQIYVSYHFEQDPTRRNLIEVTLIKHYRPKHNTQYL
jgi:hypothetical protein